MTPETILDRWPGYTEQSWQQRFAELERRYTRLSARAIDFAARTRASPQGGAVTVPREAIAQLLGDMIEQEFGVAVKASWSDDLADAILALTAAPASPAASGGNAGEVERVRAAIAPLFAGEPVGAWEGSTRFLRTPTVDEVITAILAALSNPHTLANGGEGWVYFNPDTGVEYARQHPIESGEVPDATDVRRATPMEDALYSALQTAHHVLSLPTSPKAKAPAPEQGEVKGAVPSPVTRLTKGYGNQAIDGTRMVDLIDSANCNVIARCVYEPYADEILAAVCATPSPDAGLVEVAKAIDAASNGGADTISLLIELNRIGRLARTALASRGKGA